MTMTSQTRRGPTDHFTDPFFCSLAVVKSSASIIAISSTKFRMDDRGSHRRCSLSRRWDRCVSVSSRWNSTSGTSLRRVYDSRLPIKSAIYARCSMFGYRYRNRIVSLSFERQRVYAMFSLYRHGLWLIQLVRVCMCLKKRVCKRKLKDRR